jgi:hypothetical protein
MTAQLHYSLNQGKTWVETETCSLIDVTAQKPGRIDLFYKGMEASFNLTPFVEGSWFPPFEAYKWLAHAVAFPETPQELQYAL